MSRGSSYVGLSSEGTYPKYSFYSDKLPDGEMVLEELEEYCLKRFMCLRGTMEHQGRAEEIKNKFDFPLSSATDLLHDIISHHVLRLAFCTADDSHKNWFLSAERALFRNRIKGLPYTEIDKIIKREHLDWRLLSNEENKRLLMPQFDYDEKDAETMMFYQVPFEQALDLVRSRKALVEKGFAYLSVKHIKAAALPGVFYMRLSQKLSEATRSFAGVRSSFLALDDLFKMLQNSPVWEMELSGANKRLAQTGEKCSLADIEDLAKTSFPLCARMLHYHLMHDNHLKYRGRLQYAVFLKELGMPMDDVLKLWTRTFTHTVRSQSELQENLYSVRHLYGKVGSAQPHPAYLCTTIHKWDAPVSGSDQHHGCPFNHSQIPVEELTRLLRSSRLSDEDIEELCGYEDFDSTRACMSYFAKTHRGMKEADITFSSPNQYAALSREYYKKLAAKDKASDESSTSTSTGSTSTESSQMKDEMDIETSSPAAKKPRS